MHNDWYYISVWDHNDLSDKGWYDVFGNIACTPLNLWMSDDLDDAVEMKKLLENEYADRDCDFEFNVERL